MSSEPRPNHALQRTGSAVTAPAADHHHLSTHRQVPRPLRLSLSLGSLGVAARTMRTALLLPVVIVSTALAQTPLAPNAPEDKPVASTAERLAAFENAIAPYVAKARATYPDARKRYLVGLPPKHVFFLTTRLRDKAGKFEQVFIEVQSIKDGKVTGLIASDVTVAEGFKRGERYTFPETDMLDWLISKPDGTEEGNIVGIFLDTYKP